MISILEIQYHTDLDNWAFMPRTYENDCGINISEPKIIYCKDGTRWFAFWNADEHIWQNANSNDKIYFNADSVIAYLDVPNRKDIKYLKKHNRRDIL
jgi:hypothetical protein